MVLFRPRSGPAPFVDHVERHEQASSVVVGNPTFLELKRAGSARIVLDLGTLAAHDQRELQVVLPGGASNGREHLLREPQLILLVVLSSLALISPLQLEKAARTLDQRFGLVAMWLFGSQATGRARTDSDVDLAVLFRAEISTLDLLDAASELATAWHRDVDLIDLKRASPGLAMQVLRHGKLVAERDSRLRHRFEAALPGRYEDLRIVCAPIERRIRERLHG